MSTGIERGESDFEMCTDQILSERGDWQKCYLSASDLELVFWDSNVLSPSVTSKDKVEVKKSHYRPGVARRVPEI